METQDIQKSLLKLQNEFEEFKRKVEFYEKRESSILEEELNALVLKHVSDRFIGYTPNIQPTQKLKDPYTGKVLTDLDGLIIMHKGKSKPSVSTEHADTDLQLRISQSQQIRSNDMNKMKKSLRSIEQSASRVLVIVEAKRYINKDKVLQKMRQYLQIQDMIREAKLIANGESRPKLHKSFYGTAKALKLADVQQVKLYIGGPMWESDALKQMKEYAELNHSLGYIIPSGTRFEIMDASRQ